GLLLEQLAEGNNIISIEETPQFQTVGPMFDMSRNAVMNEKAFKSMIHRLAIMGFNAAMLYMEDTYEVKGEPYFGYMRGRYSQQELNNMMIMLINLELSLFLVSKHWHTWKSF